MISLLATALVLFTCAPTRAADAYRPQNDPQTISTDFRAATRDWEHATLHRFDGPPCLLIALPKSCDETCEKVATFWNDTTQKAPSGLLWKIDCAKEDVKEVCTEQMWRQTGTPATHPLVMEWDRPHWKSYQGKRGFEGLIKAMEAAHVRARNSSRIVDMGVAELAKSVQWKAATAGTDRCNLTRGSWHKKTKQHITLDVTKPPSGRDDLFNLTSQRAHKYACNSDFTMAWTPGGATCRTPTLTLGKWQKKKFVFVGGSTTRQMVEQLEWEFSEKVSARYVNAAFLFATTGRLCCSYDGSGTLDLFRIDDQVAKAVRTADFVILNVATWWSSNAIGRVIDQARP